MKYLIATLIATTVAATANADSIYRCEVSTVRMLEPNGKLVRTEFAEMVERLDEVIIFDSASGLFRYQGESGTYEFTVLQQSSPGNAMKAARIFQGPSSAVMETFRIETYAEGEFIYVAGLTVKTGKCETL